MNQTCRKCGASDWGTWGKIRARRRCRPCRAGEKREQRQRNLKAARDYEKTWRDKNKDRIKSYPSRDSRITSERVRQWKRENPERTKSNSRDRWLRRRFGISLQIYERLLNEQDGACAVCKDKKPQDKRALAVDHDHKTDEIRGLLCSQCNTGLGMFRDNPEYLRNAIAYLKNAKTQDQEGR